MSARSKAIKVGFFVVSMLMLSVTMLLVVSQGGLLGEENVRFELVYDTSIKGLEVGAPVTLRGVPVGEVASIRSRFYPDALEPLNSVIVDIYPERIELDSYDQIGDEDILALLLARGLSAKLRTQSLLTGLLYIEIDFYDVEPRMSSVVTRYPQLQTVPSDLEFLDEELSDIDIKKLAEDMQQILANINSFTSSSDFQHLAYNVNQTLGSIEQAGNEVTAVTTELELLVTDMRSAVNEAGEVADRAGAHLAPDSPLVHNLNQTMQSINRASRSVEQLMDTLERQPESIVFGKGGN